MINPERVEEIIKTKGVRIPEVAQDAHFWLESQEAKLEKAESKSVRKALKEDSQEVSRRTLGVGGRVADLITAPPQQDSPKASQR
ncbi:MAG TPA: hypothetical protein VFA93_01200 [Patescibacteria group bacterium]|nr:hypothetical protein [Patescibacteria group bacterium]